MAESTHSVKTNPQFRNRLHYQNINRINRDDVIVASCGAAGQTLLANILLKLDLNYVNPATEVLLPDGTSVPDKQMLAYRSRFAAMHARDTAEADAPRRGPRFVKTHLFPQEFAGREFAGVWLLVRDPRDALYSLYKFRRDFADVPWEKVPDSFQKFLHELDYTGQRPVDDWSAFNQIWLDRAKRCTYTAITRFEDLKSNGSTTIRDALRAFDIEVSYGQIERAVERSSFENMRAHEDSVAAHHQDKSQFRIMRKGKVGEWTEWMTPQLATYFSTHELASVAARFGYTMSA